MSEKQEHRKRFNERYQYTLAMERWLLSEPPIIRFIKWHRWKKSRPVYYSEKMGGLDR